MPNPADEPVRVRKIGWHAVRNVAVFMRRHSYHEQLGTENNERKTKNENETERETSIKEENRKNLLKKKEAKLEELKQTEENYLRDLKRIHSFINVDMKKSKDDPDYPLQMPELLKEMEYICIGNFNDVFDFHQEVFSNELISGIKCAEKTRDLLRKRNYDMKNRYGTFCSNWTKSEYILQKFKSYFKKMEQHSDGDISLVDDLIRPIQMLNRYHLFFGDLVNICGRLEEDENTQLYKECLHISKDISQNSNDVMATGKIKNFPEAEDIAKQGVLIKRGNVNCKIPKNASFFHLFDLKTKQNRTKNMPAHIFLFKQRLVVSHFKKSAKEFGIGDEYRFWTMFLVNKMKIDDAENNDFILIDEETSLKLRIVAETAEEKDIWVGIIKEEIKGIERRLTNMMIPKASFDQGGSFGGTPPSSA